MIGWGAATAQPDPMTTGVMGHARDPGAGPGHERGSVTLWVLYWSMSVLFISGFGLDLWRGVSVRRSLVEQAEAAASAGANAVDVETFRRTGEVVIDPGLADEMARANLRAQGDADLVDRAQITVDPGTQEVTVTLEAAVDFTLVKVFLSGEAPLQVGVTARARVFVYNPDLVAAPPADIWALTEPEWAGKVGVAPTNGSFVAFVSAMVLTEGEERTLEWLSGIASNDPVIFDGNAPIVAATDAGDIAGGLVNHYYLLRLADEQGVATAVNHSFPSGDPGSLVMVSGAGLLKTAENRDEALRFLEFLVSDETQAFFLSEILEYPLVEGAGTPPGQTPLADLPTLDLDLSQLATTVDRATQLIAEAGLT